MKVKIKRIDKSLPLPKYHTKGSIAFDLLSRIEIKLKPWEVSLIPMNIIVKIPKGLGLLVVPRSSVPRKKGLLIPHGIGIIDQDYCGPEDEVLLQVINFTKKVITIERGERIAQAMVIKILQAEIEEIEKIKDPTRGGVGSTG